VGVDLRFLTSLACPALPVYWAIAGSVDSGSNFLSFLEWYRSSVDAACSYETLGRARLSRSAPAGLLDVYRRALSQACDQLNQPLAQPRVTQFTLFPCHFDFRSSNTHFILGGQHGMTTRLRKELRSEMTPDKLLGRFLVKKIRVDFFEKNISGKLEQTQAE
jgi:hypothetical protein